MRARRLIEPVALGDEPPCEAEPDGGLLSAIVPMFQDRTDVVEVYHAYKAAIARIGRPFELIYVVDRQSEQALRMLQELKESGENSLVLVVGRQLSEADALISGFA
jgi:hypothetical protein